MSFIFLSYVEEDDSLIPEIASLLEAAGNTTWYYQRDSVIGHPYPQQIADAINSCDALVVIFSSNSIDSPQIDREVTLGFSRKKQLIPLLVGMTHSELQHHGNWAYLLGAAVDTPVDGLTSKQISDLIITALNMRPYLRPEIPRDEPNRRGHRRRTVALPVLASVVFVLAGLFLLKDPIDGLIDERRATATNMVNGPAGTSVEVSSGSRATPVALTPAQPNLAMTPTVVAIDGTLVEESGPATPARQSAPVALASASSQSEDVLQEDANRVTSSTTTVTIPSTPVQQEASGIGSPIPVGSPTDVSPTHAGSALRSDENLVLPAPTAIISNVLLSDPALAVSGGSAMRQGNPGRTGVQAGPGPGPNPAMLWQFHADGQILSSPVIADAMVIFGTDSGIVYALDGRSGNQKWSFDTGDTIRTSPALYGDMVIFSVKSGSLFSLSTSSGDQVWKVDVSTETVPADEFALSSVLVAGDTAFVCDISGELVALRADTGTILWRTKIGTGICSAPSTDGMRVFTTSSSGAGGRLVAVDGVSGEIIWSVNLTSKPSTFPVTNGELVIVSTADGTTNAFDALDGEMRWWMKTLNEVLAPPLISDGKVFISDSFAGEFYALNVQTGEIVWQHTIENPYDEYSNFPGWYGSASIVGDVVIWGNGEFADLWALNAQTGAELWTVYTNGERVNTSPAVASGIVYVGGMDGTFFAYGA